MTVSGKKIEPRQLNDIEAEFINTDFKIKYNRNEINPIIISRFTNPMGIPIANPGEKINVGCILNPKLPSVSLRFAGEVENMAFVFYDQGGFAYTTNLMILKLDKEKIVYECSYWIGGINQIKTLDDLKAIFPIKSEKTANVCGDSSSSVP